MGERLEIVWRKKCKCETEAMVLPPFVVRPSQYGEILRVIIKFEHTPHCPKCYMDWEKEVEG